MKKLLLIISILILVSMMSCGDLPETFKVIYRSEGSTFGFPPNDNKEYKSGEYATVLGKNTLVKEEYDSFTDTFYPYQFSGWNTKADYSGDTYKENEKIQIKNFNIFLFPVWK